MTLVERFIEFQRWPTSRKTVLLMIIAFAAHALITPVAIYYASESHVVDAARLSWAASSAIPVILICLLAGWSANCAGKEGRWTAYLVVAGYGSWVLTMDMLFGIWSTPMLAWVTADVILVALWYDERVGLIALIGFLIVFSVIVGSTLTGLLPYAPLIRERSLDAQSHGGWVLTLLAAFIGFFLYDFLLSVLVVAARRLQDQRLRQAYQQLERSTQLIRRYVPAQVADEVLSGREHQIDKHERRKLTIFFSDLVGFTEIAEDLEPEDLSRVLNEYFAEMTTIAHGHGGTIDEISGDAILIFFGAPNATNDKDHALHAARMAMEMQSAVAKLNGKWRAAGIAEELRVRMGINTGVVTIGNFGSPDRMKYAALGKHVNLAARLQAQCEPGRVLVSQSTWLLINDQLVCVEKGHMQLKGFHKPVMTYELANQR